MKLSATMSSRQASHRVCDSGVPPGDGRSGGHRLADRQFRWLHPFAERRPAPRPRLGSGPPARGLGGSAQVCATTRSALAHHHIDPHGTFSRVYPRSPSEDPPACGPALEHQVDLLDRPPTGVFPHRTSALRPPSQPGWSVEQAVCCLGTCRSHGDPHLHQVPGRRPGVRIFLKVRHETSFASTALPRRTPLAGRQPSTHLDPAGTGPAGSAPYMRLASGSSILRFCGTAVVALSQRARTVFVASSGVPWPCGRSAAARLLPEPPGQHSARTHQCRLIRLVALLSPRGLARPAGASPNMLIQDADRLVQSWSRPRRDLPKRSPPGQPARSRSGRVPDRVRADEIRASCYLGRPQEVLVEAPLGGLERRTRLQRGAVTRRSA